MLDKKVVKFTRDGLMEENLATGESKMLTLSDYARETKYDNPERESRYEPGHSSPEMEHTKRLAPPIGKSRRSYPAGKRVPATDLPPKEMESYLEAQHKYQAHRDETAQPLSSRKDGPPGDHSPDGDGAPHYTYGGPSGKQRTSGKKQEPKYYYSAKADGDKIPTHADLRKGTIAHAGLRAAKHIVKDAISEHKEDDDNLGLQSAGSVYRTARHIRSGIRAIKKVREKNRTVFETTERTVGHYGFGTAEKAAGQSVKGASAGIQRTVEAAGRGAAKGVGALAKSSVMLKVMMVVGIIFLILLIMQILCFSIGGVFGSVTESAHPDLNTFVEQLDNDFQAKIEALKKQYEKSSDTVVEIQGSDVINTDPNVLAILATGDWTDIDLTEENKAKLTSCYNILTTYTVTKEDKKVKEISGTGSESTSTEHHITITIKVYQAKDKIDAFGFTDVQKKNVLDMLATLDEIEDSGAVESAPAIPNPGTGGSTPDIPYGSSRVQALFTEADKYLGYPYVWGGSNPSTSFDCSGFVCWVFTHSGVHNLPRDSAQGLYNRCTPVSASEAKPGDLIFFTKTYPTSNTVTHVGIYAGNDRMLHCGDPIQYTTLNKAYWRQHFYSFGRLK